MNRVLIALASLAILGTATAAGAAAASLRDGSFEKPKVGDGGLMGFSTGDKFGPWTVVGASGNVHVISTDFTQNGFTFEAKKGSQWLDLTGTSNTATGVQQTISTTPGAAYEITCYVGSVYDPTGIFGASSTVNVLVDGTAIASFTTKAKSGSTQQQWRKFTAEFTAQGKKSSIAFINGDPSDDTDNGLDGISVQLATP